MTSSPQQEIRRFDIFAEWNRLKANQQLHLSAAESRAYGLAVAKVVAARKFSGTAPSQLKDWKRRARSGGTAEPWWQHLGAEEEFRRKIVQQMAPGSIAWCFSLRFARPGKKESVMRRFAIR